MTKEEKFNQIVHDNQDRIKRICRYYNANETDQQDMYQEILVNIWNSLDNFRGDSSVSTWIYRVAVNTSLTYTGKAYKNMKLIVSSNNENLGFIIDDSSLETKKLEEERFEILQTELHLLSVIDKALISLMLEGQNMKEIADIIGISEANVKVKIHRIKKQLKDKLTDKIINSNYDQEDNSIK